MLPALHTPSSLHDVGWASTDDRSRLHKDPTTPERQQKLRRYLHDLPPGSKVLDYGCGRAEFTAYLASLGFRTVGLDLSEQAIQFNRRDFPSIEFVLSRANEPCSFVAGHFDAIWASEVIEHVYDVHAIFAEFSRILRVGGKLIVTTPYHGWLKNILIVTFGFERHFDVEWQHIRFWTKRNLTKVAGAHHFKPLVWDSVGRVPWLAKSFFVVFERIQN